MIEEEKKFTGNMQEKIRNNLEIDNDQEAKKATSRYMVFYTVLFVLSVLIIYIPFLNCRKTLVSFADGFNQYYPVYIYTGRYLRHLPGAILSSHQIPQFDFSIGLGDDIIGTLNYYGFGSIFNLFSAFIPAKYACIGYSVTIILKFYLAGYSYSLYARNRVIDEKSILTGMLLYAFQGYALYYATIFYSFGDVLVFFPCCLLAADLIMEGKKRGGLLLSASVFCLALSGFYFLYIVSVAIIFYFVVIASGKKNVNKKVCLVRGIGSYLLGCCMSGAILMPALYSFLHSSRVSNNGQSFTQYLLSIPDCAEVKKQLIALFLPQYEDGLGIPLVCTALIVWALLYKKRKKCCGVLFLILASFIPIVGSIMNGFSYSTNRWEFVIYFAVSWEVTAILDSCKEGCKKLISIGCVANLVLYCLIFNSKWVINFRTPQNTYQEITNSTLAHFTYLNQESESTESINRLDIYDTSLGGSLALNVGATSSYFSISNGYLYDFFNSTLISSGIRGATFCLRGLDGRQSLESLLSVRYFSKDADGTEIIENEFQLPIGTIFTESVSENMVQGYHPLSISSMLSHCLILNDVDDEANDSDNLVIDSIDKEDITVQTESISMFDGIMQVEEGGKITIVPENTVCANREYYIYIRGLKYEENLNEAQVNIGDKNFVLKGIKNRAYIGELSDYLVKVDGNVPCTVQFEQSGTYTMESIELLSIDLTNYSSNYQKLISNGCLNDIKINGNVLCGNVNAETDGYLFLSIPYSEGWKCLIDNKPMQLIRTDYAFMSVPITEGKHQVVLQYHSPWLMKGARLSAFGWIIWMVLWLKNRSVSGVIHLKWKNN